MVEARRGRLALRGRVLRHRSHARRARKWLEDLPRTQSRRRARRQRATPIGSTGTCQLPRLPTDAETPAADIEIGHRSTTSLPPGQHRLADAVDLAVRRRHGNHRQQSGRHGSAEPRIPQRLSTACDHIERQRRFRLASSGGTGGLPASGFSGRNVPRKALTSRRLYAGGLRNVIDALLKTAGVKPAARHQTHSAGGPACPTSSRNPSAARIRLLRVHSATLLGGNGWTPSRRSMLRHWCAVVHAVRGDMRDHDGGGKV